MRSLPPELRQIWDFHRIYFTTINFYTEMIVTCVKNESYITEKN